MEDRFNVLVVDDELVIQNLLRDVLESKGHYVRTTGNGEEALSIMTEEDFDVLLSDIQMPGMGGLELLKRAKRLSPDILAVMITGHATVETAVEAIKLGAADFLTKPIRDIEQIPVVFKKALQFQQLQKEIVVLRELTRSHEEFFALLSHELRTPLTNIRSSLELISDLYSSGLSPDLLELLNLVSESAGEMGCIVENLLLAAELQMGRAVLAKQKVDLNSFLARFLDGFLDKFSGEHKGPVIEKEFHPCEEPLSVLVDEGLMGKALSNILDNAVKFNEKLPRLKITVRTFREEEMVKFVVQNDGAPVESKHHHSIFRKFKQVDHYMTRRVGGLGLGLPVAKAIMEKHAGSVVIEQAEEGGVAFVFTLPALKEQSSALLTEGASPG